MLEDIFIGDCDNYLRRVDQTINTASMTDKDLHSLLKEATSFVSRFLYEALHHDGPASALNSMSAYYGLIFTYENFIISLMRDTPASTKYHGAFRGGLLVHTACVMALCAINAHQLDTKDFKRLVRAAFLHDIGKCGLMCSDNSDGNSNGIIVTGYYMLDEKKSVHAEKQVFKRNPAIPDHVEVAQFNLLTLQKQYPDTFDLDFETWLAITYHNGAYHENLKWPVRGRETMIMMTLHYADMVASRKYV